MDKLDIIRNQSNSSLKIGILHVFMYHKIINYLLLQKIIINNIFSILKD